MDDRRPSRGPRSFLLGQREVDLDACEVRTGSDRTRLTRNEQRLLEFLIAAGGPVSSDDLLEHALGYAPSVRSRAVDQAVWRLRRKLEDDPAAPRHLLFVADQGYVLHRTVEPPPAALAGRNAERARLAQLWRAETPVIAICGPPGMGKSALVRAWLAELPVPTAVDDGRTEPLQPPDATVWVLDPAGPALHTLPPRTCRTLILVDRAAPADPHVPRVHVGGLAPEDGVQLLTERILAVRGESELQAADRVHLGAWTERVDGHPGLLDEVAVRATLRGLADVELDDDGSAITAARAWLAELPPPIVDALVVWSELPQPFSVADAEAASATDVREVWRLGGLVADLEPTRLLRVPWAVRRACALDHPDGQARLAPWIDQLIGELTPSLEALAHTGSGVAHHRLVEAVPRTVRAARAAGPAQLDALLPALAQGLPYEPRPDWLVTAVRDHTPRGDAAAAWRAMVLSGALEATDPAGALTVLEAHWRDDLPSGVAGPFLRMLFRMRERADLDITALDEVAARMRAAAERDPTPLAAVLADHLTGILVARQGDRDGRALLESAAGRYEALGASHLASVVVSNLATLAERDGRYADAVRWTRVALDDPHADEISERADIFGRLAEQLAPLDAAAAREALEDASRLGLPAREVRTIRAVIALMEDDLPQASMLLRRNSGVALRGHFSDVVRFYLAWIDVLRGLNERARASLAELEQAISRSPGLWPLSMCAATDDPVAADALRQVAVAELRGFDWAEPLDLYLTSLITCDLAVLERGDRLRRTLQVDHPLLVLLGRLVVTRCAATPR